MELSWPHIHRNNNEGTIVFNPSLSFDEAEYQCIVSNIHGRAYSRTVVLRRAALTQLPTLPPQQYIAYEGEGLVLPCTPADSVPEGTLIWVTVADLDSTEVIPVVTSDRVYMTVTGKRIYNRWHYPRT